MKRSRLLWIGVLFAVSATCGCHSPYRRDQGALVGGLTGAGLGAAIGENSDNPLAGAAIGAAVGTLAGAAIGDNVDAQIEHNNAMIEQKLGARLAGAVTNQQVVSMTRSGLGEEVILTHIQANGVARRPNAEDLIALKNQGVSDRVLNALQQQPPIAVATPVATPPPYFVERHHHWSPPGCFYPPFWNHHWHFRRAHRPGLSWGVSFAR